MDEEKRVALITGGGTGIGAATAQRLAADGYQVVVTGRRMEPIEAVASEIGGHAVVSDTSREIDCHKAVETTLEQFGRLDVLIANAGVETFGSAAEVDLTEWRHVMEVNVDGVLLAVRASVEALKESRGAVVVVASVAALAAGPSFSAYVTSKTALLGLVRSLAVDLGPSGVRVNAICPGWVATEMSDREVVELGRRHQRVAELGELLEALELGQRRAAGAAALLRHGNFQNPRGIGKGGHRAASQM